MTGGSFLRTACLTLLMGLGLFNAQAQDLTSIPTGKGLPVVVRAAVYYNEVASFGENEEQFEATTDLRLTWEDPRLRYPREEGLHGYKEWTMSAAEAEIAKLWMPKIRVVNRVGEPSYAVRRLRIYPDGRVETMTRTTAAYKTPVDVAKFPFDHQSLEIQIAVEEDIIENVDLDFSSQDVEFSRAAANAKLGGWTLGFVNLKRDIIKGWNGDRYATLTAALDVKRVAIGTLATIFIPLFASLLIPFFATWLNKVEDGEFAVDSFELANIIIGGLFAVIALSFTVSSSYPILAEGDNTVTRLIGLNYIALSVGLLITVGLYRYNIPKRIFGPYVQEQMFLFLMWAFPLVFIVSGIAFVFLAAV
ncbi:hypothetical protein ACFSM5_07500 [Lacibacterium aquatile]|uniref:Neurotransmitter-gated ion-channel ligand-binding domain-containing protein n=1 Tax=Lacibacterium aquatile TaxID=1168082 RepID=A0ABW5DP77_9PROT